jgi:DASH complex subunit DAD1
LANINKLNRSLEAVIAVRWIPPPFLSLTHKRLPHPPGHLLKNPKVGNEFSSVEALWSQFETVMGRENAEEGPGLQGDAPIDPDAAGART